MASNEPFSVAKALAALDDAVRETAERRLDELRGYMSACFHTELRDDSRLAFLFACGTAPFPYQSTYDVAHELSCVDKLHKHTPYAAVAKEESRVAAAALVTHGLSWKDAWGVVRAHHFDVLKYRCLLETGLRF